MRQGHLPPHRGHALQDPHFEEVLAAQNTDPDSPQQAGPIEGPKDSRFRAPIHQRNVILPYHPLEKASALPCVRYSAQQQEGGGGILSGL